ncbi:hypothetical protein CYMTET_24985 [Cymbomonas tetramitiformis]|uniref:Cyclic nucleotide-binding domain-containing protein n=1 Tax=Cymbomonas tetramitiformis TaxID=36881 RepID=A0AAE0FUY6_9CHLO|nr:hypothetical protein CYMTET_24985 [Cymbomonas tetramitiformis]
MGDGAGGYFSMGYEQAVPKTVPEILASVATLFIALVMEAYVLGILFHYLVCASLVPIDGSWVKKDPNVEAFQKRMQSLYTYMEHRNLPSHLREEGIGQCAVAAEGDIETVNRRARLGLPGYDQHQPPQERLVQYFEFQYSKQDAVSSNEVMASLPLSLQMKICSYQYQDVISRNRALFRSCNEQFLSMMTVRLKEVYLMPGEVLLKQVGDGDGALAPTRPSISHCSELSNAERRKEMSLSSDIDRSDVGRKGTETPGARKGTLKLVNSPAGVQSAGLLDVPDDLISNLGVRSLFRRHSHFLCCFSTTDVVLRTVRADSDDATVVGEVAFFMGIPEPYTYVSRSTSDCTLLVFSKDDYDELIGNFPEQHDLLMTHLLAEYELDKVGTDINSGNVADDADENILALKESIQAALVKRNSDALAALTYAASEGDVDMVSTLLKRGLSVNSGDYDARTTLHLACAEGNLRVVELLVAEGADINLRDRWGNTALYDAIQNKHGQIIDYLYRHGGRLVTDNAAGMLCAAASEGDVSAMTTLINNDVDPNIGDYDARTGKWGA